MECSCGCGQVLPVRPYPTKYLSGHNNNWSNYSRPTITCLGCKRRFKSSPSVIALGRHYCSRRCYADRSPKIRLLCEWCKKEFDKYQCEIEKGMKNHYCSKFCYEQHRKNGYALKKENHPQWKGGITPEKRAIRSRYLFKKWRKDVLNRDGNICVICGSKEKIQAHHIKGFSLYPELRLKIDNGETLCSVCHSKTESYGHKKQFRITLTSRYGRV